MENLKYQGAITKITYVEKKKFSRPQNTIETKSKIGKKWREKPSKLDRGLKKTTQYDQS